jgi:hypothetical protein
MGASSVKRSGIKSGVKYIKSMVGNLIYPWLTPTVWVKYASILGTGVAAATDRIPLAWNNSGEALISLGGPGNMSGFVNYGLVYNYYGYSSIGYASYAGSWNGYFLGSGNYSSSSVGFKKNITDGWTVLNGYSSYSGSGGIGTGNTTSAGVPVWLIPVTTGSSHLVLSSPTIPTALSWTTNTVTANSSHSAGYINKVAMAGDVVAYGYHTSTTRTGANMVVRYAAVTPSTGAISATWNTATFDFAPGGPLLNLVSLNGAFILTTTYGDVYTSANGSSFIRRQTGTGGYALQVTTEHNGYVMGYISNYGYSASYTTDGITWTATNTLNGVSYAINNIGIGKGVRLVTSGGESTSVWRNV